MILVNLLGFICSRNVVIFIKFSLPSNNLKFAKKIVTMQTDWGDKYEKLHGIFQRVGISHHVSCPHVRQQKVLLNANTVVLLRLMLLYFPMPP
jgi:hypothetical protein